MLPYVPLGPLLVWVLGLDGAKSGRQATKDELATLKGMLHEAMDAGGCGWSAQRLPPYGGMANQRDFDGSPMPTDCMPDETALAFAEVLGERNEGFMQMTYVSGDIKHDLRHYEELAEVSGRPMIYNVVVGHDNFPDRHRKQLKWLDSCRERGIPVYGQAVTTAAGFTFTMEGWNLFDDSEAWMEATTGTHEERLRKLGDPARRDKLRYDSAAIENGAVIQSFANIALGEGGLPRVQGVPQLPAVRHRRAPGHAPGRRHARHLGGRQPPGDVLRRVVGQLPRHPVGDHLRPVHDPRRVRRRRPHQVLHRRALPDRDDHHVRPGQQGALAGGGALEAVRPARPTAPGSRTGAR